MVNPKEKERNLSSKKNLLCLPVGYFLTNTFPLQHVLLLPPSPQPGGVGEGSHVIKQIITLEHVAVHKSGIKRVQTRVFSSRQRLYVHILLYLQSSFLTFEDKVDKISEPWSYISAALGSLRLVSFDHVTKTNFPISCFLASFCLSLQPVSAHVSVFLNNIANIFSRWRWRRLSNCRVLRYKNCACAHQERPQQWVRPAAADMRFSYREVYSSLFFLITHH